MYRKELCVTLGIYQESLQGARSTKYTFLFVVQGTASTSNILYSVIMNLCRKSVVGIRTRYSLVRTLAESRFSAPREESLESTQSSLQCVPGLFPRCKATRE